MHRNTRRDRGWPARDQEVEIWGRTIDRDDWLRGSYGPPEGDRRHGRGPAWDRGERWGEESSAGWDRLDDDQPAWERPRHPAWDRPEEPIWGRQDRAGWQRSPNFDWQTREVGARGPYGASTSPPRRLGYADEWTDQRHWHGRTTMRDYARSDERIREDVCNRMCDHPAIDTTEMRVLVEHGEVTLEGWVDDRFEKRLAEDLAERVPGVTDVHNRLRTNGQRDPNRRPSPPAEGVPDA